VSVTAEPMLLPSAQWSGLRVGCTASHDAMRSASPKAADPGTAGDTSIVAASTSPMPGRHVRRLRRPVGSGTEELVAVVGVDVMGLHHPVRSKN
jgi:hypothetical protein